MISSCFQVAENNFWERQSWLEFMNHRGKKNRSLLVISGGQKFLRYEKNVCLNLKVNDFLNICRSLNV